MPGYSLPLKNCQWTVWGDVGAEAFLCCSSKLSFSRFFDVKTSLWCCHSSEHPYTHTTVRNIFIYSCKIAPNHPPLSFSITAECQIKLTVSVCTRASCAPDRTDSRGEAKEACDMCSRQQNIIRQLLSLTKQHKCGYNVRREKLIPLYCIVHVMVELNSKMYMDYLQYFGTTHP